MFIFIGETQEFIEEDGFASVELPKETVEVVNEVDTEAHVPISRFDSLAGNVTVDWFTRENTAIAGTHFTDVTGTAEFGRGEEEKEAIVPLIPFPPGDTGDKSFTVELGLTEDCEIVGRYETEVIIKDNKPGIKTSLLSRHDINV